MPLQPGQVLNNRYRIVRLLGQGGFGAVYRAWDTNLNRPCAVKENLDTSPEAQRQFTREATILANLSHPNLPRVTAHFILPGQGQYLVMDFVEGEDLASMMKRQGSAPIEQALTWVYQVADALKYLHSRQPPVVHRDIKPANIRITPEGRAMLVDFGLVKLYDPHLHTTLGARAVTPGYAPPEQYGQGKTDARTDQYALAATLYNLLTGQEPMESVQRMAGGQMRLAHQINPRIPMPLSLAIDRAMRLEPSQRFPNIADFSAALSASTAPGVVARQSPEAYVRPMSPVPATQVVPSAAAPEIPGYAPASSPRSSGLPVKSIGLAIAVFVVLCLGMFILIGALIANSQANAQKTADAQIQATMAERVRATSTAQAVATMTAQVYAQQTAQVQMTADALSAYLASLQGSRVLVYGPANGSLTHEASDALIQTNDAGVNLRDFIVEARFYNPYSLATGSWDYGFILRHETKNVQFRFVILSDKTWVLLNNSGDPDGTLIAEGELPGLDVSEKGSNLVRLIFQGKRGLFFLNDAFIAEFDLSSRMNSGGIYIATGVYQDDEIDGYSTDFSDFTIWSIP
jgi:hypothetical protein